MEQVLHPPRTIWHWLLTHAVLLLIWLVIFVAIAVLTVGWSLSSPINNQEFIFEKTVNILYSSLGILILYPFVVVISAILYRKSRSYRVVSVLTAGILCVLSVLVLLYWFSASEYRRINAEIVADKTVSDDPINDYVCVEKDGDKAFFTLHESQGRIVYTIVRANGSFTSGGSELSVSTKTFTYKGSFGANFEWKSGTEKDIYLQKCVNSTGESLLDKYTYISNEGE